MSSAEWRLRSSNANRINSHGLVVGIDATNLRQGGGRTHLIELLRAVDPRAYGINRVVVWGSMGTLNMLDDQVWIRKVNIPALERGLLSRTFWQRFRLSQEAEREGCDVLFVPGGSFAGRFRPVVSMCQNMLPFELRELRRYGWTSTALKLLLLRFTQTRTFARAKGIIFLTRYAKRQVLSVTGPLKGEAVIIPHGLSSRFSMTPRPQRGIHEYSHENPYRILYVSVIDHYKHPWHVVRAVAELRQRTEWPLVLDLIGPSQPSALKRLMSCLNLTDPEGGWVRYYGEVPYVDLHQFYAGADLGIFASSCENMPNILLETMAAGLPVACSNRGPMPEILQNAGVYFDPEIPSQIAMALERLIDSPKLREDMSSASFAATSEYTWKSCADATFQFLADIGRH